MAKRAQTSKRLLPFDASRNERFMENEASEKRWGDVGDSSYSTPSDDTRNLETKRPSITNPRAVKQDQVLRRRLLPSDTSGDDSVNEHKKSGKWWEVLDDGSDPCPSNLDSKCSLRDSKSFMSQRTSSSGFSCSDLSLESKEVSRMIPLKKPRKVLVSPRQYNLAITDETTVVERTLHRTMDPNVSSFKVDSSLDDVSRSEHAENINPLYNRRPKRKIGHGGSFSRILSDMTHLVSHTSVTDAVYEQVDKNSCDVISKVACDIYQSEEYEGPATATYCKQTMERNGATTTYVTISEVKERVQIQNRSCRVPNKKYNSPFDMSEAVTDLTVNSECVFVQHMDSPTRQSSTFIPSDSRKKGRTSQDTNGLDILIETQNPSESFSDAEVEDISDLLNRSGPIEGRKCRRGGQSGENKQLLAICASEFEEGLCEHADCEKSPPSSMDEQDKDQPSSLSGSNGIERSGKKKPGGRITQNVDVPREHGERNIERSGKKSRHGRGSAGSKNSSSVSASEFEEIGGEGPPYNYDKHLLSPHEDCGINQKSSLSLSESLERSGKKKSGRKIKKISHAYSLKEHGGTSLGTTNSSSFNENTKLDIPYFPYFASKRKRGKTERKMSINPGVFDNAFDLESTIGSHSSTGINGSNNSGSSYSSEANDSKRSRKKLSFMGKRDAHGSDAATGSGTIESRGKGLHHGSNSSKSDSVEIQNLESSPALQKKKRKTLLAISSNTFDDVLNSDSVLNNHESHNSDDGREQNDNSCVSDENDVEERVSNDFLPHEDDVLCQLESQTIGRNVLESGKRKSSFSNSLRCAKSLESDAKQNSLILNRSRRSCKEVSINSSEFMEALDSDSKSRIASDKAAVNKFSVENEHSFKNDSRERSIRSIKSISLDEVSSFEIDDTDAPRKNPLFERKQKKNLAPSQYAAELVQVLNAKGKEKSDKDDSQELHDEKELHDKKSLWRTRSRVNSSLNNSESCRRPNTSCENEQLQDGKGESDSECQSVASDEVQASPIIKRRVGKKSNLSINSSLFTGALESDGKSNSGGHLVNPSGERVLSRERTSLKGAGSPDGGCKDGVSSMKTLQPGDSELQPGDSECSERDESQSLDEVISLDIDEVNKLVTRQKKRGSKISLPFPTYENTEAQRCKSNAPNSHAHNASVNEDDGKVKEMEQSMENDQLRVGGDDRSKSFEIHSLNENSLESDAVDRSPFLRRKRKKRNDLHIDFNTFIDAISGNGQEVLSSDGKHTSKSSSCVGISENEGPSDDVQANSVKTVAIDDAVEGGLVKEKESICRGETANICEYETNPICRENRRKNESHPTSTSAVIEDEVSKSKSDQYHSIKSGLNDESLSIGETSSIGNQMGQVFKRNRGKKAALPINASVFAGVLGSDLESDCSSVVCPLEAEPDEDKKLEASGENISEDGKMDKNQLVESGEVENPSERDEVGMQKVEVEILDEKSKANSSCNRSTNDQSEQNADNFGVKVQSSVFQNNGEKNDDCPVSPCISAAVLSAKSDSNSSIVPPEVSPSEDSPPRDSIPEACSSEACPPESCPSEVSPTTVSPTEASSPETRPTEASPTEASSTEASPTKASSFETIPTEASPTKTIPSETSPIEASPTEGNPYECSHPKGSLPEACSSENRPTEASLTEAILCEDSPPQDCLPEASPTEDSPSQDSPSKDTLREENHVEGCLSKGSPCEACPPEASPSHDCLPEDRLPEACHLKYCPHEDNTIEAVRGNKEDPLCNIGKADGGHKSMDAKAKKNSMSANKGVSESTARKAELSDREGKLGKKSFENVPLDEKPGRVSSSASVMNDESMSVGDFSVANKNNAALFQRNRGKKNAAPINASTFAGAFGSDVESDCSSVCPADAVVENKEALSNKTGMIGHKSILVDVLMESRAVAKGMTVSGDKSEASVNAQENESIRKEENAEGVDPEAKHSKFQLTTYTVNDDNFSCAEKSSLSIQKEPVFLRNNGGKKTALPINSRVFAGVLDSVVDSDNSYTSEVICGSKVGECGKDTEYIKTIDSGYGKLNSNGVTEIPTNSQESGAVICDEDKAIPRKEEGGRDVSHFAMKETPVNLDSDQKLRRNDSIKTCSEGESLPVGGKSSIENSNVPVLQRNRRKKGPLPINVSVFAGAFGSDLDSDSSSVFCPSEANAASKEEECGIGNVIVKSVTSVDKKLIVEAAFQNVVIIPGSTVVNSDGINAVETTQKAMEGRYFTCSKIKENALISDMDSKNKRKDSPIANDDDESLPVGVKNSIENPNLPVFHRRGAKKAPLPINSSVFGEALGSDLDSDSSSATCPSKAVVGGKDEECGKSNIRTETIPSTDRDPKRSGLSGSPISSKGGSSVGFAEEKGNQIPIKEENNPNLPIFQRNRGKKAPLPVNSSVFAGALDNNGESDTSSIACPECAQVEVEDDSLLPEGELDKANLGNGFFESTRGFIVLDAKSPFSRINKDYGDLSCILTESTIEKNPLEQVGNVIPSVGDVPQEVHLSGQPLNTEALGHQGEAAGIVAISGDMPPQQKDINSSRGELLLQPSEVDPVSKVGSSPRESRRSTENEAVLPLPTVVSPQKEGSPSCEKCASEPPAVINAPEEGSTGRNTRRNSAMMEAPQSPATTPKADSSHSKKSSTSTTNDIPAPEQGSTGRNLKRDSEANRTLEPFPIVPIIQKEGLSPPSETVPKPPVSAHSPKQASRGRHSLRNGTRRVSAIPTPIASIGSKKGALSTGTDVPSESRRSSVHKETKLPLPLSGTLPSVRRKTSDIGSKNRVVSGIKYVSSSDEDNVSPSGMESHPATTKSSVMAKPSTSPCQGTSSATKSPVTEPLSKISAITSTEGQMTEKATAINATFVIDAADNSHKENCNINQTFTITDCKSERGVPLTPSSCNLNNVTFIKACSSFEPILAPNTDDSLSPVISNISDPVGNIVDPEKESGTRTSLNQCNDPEPEVLAPVPISEVSGPEILRGNMPVESISLKLAKEDELSILSKISLDKSGNSVTEPNLHHGSFDLAKSLSHRGPILEIQNSQMSMIALHVSPVSSFTQSKTQDVLPRCEIICQSPGETFVHIEPDQNSRKSMVVSGSPADRLPKFSHSNAVVADQTSLNVPSPQKDSSSYPDAGKDKTTNTSQLIVESPEQIIDDASSVKSVGGAETVAPYQVPVSDPEKFKGGQEKEVYGSPTDRLPKFSHSNTVVADQTSLNAPSPQKDSSSYPDAGKDKTTHTSQLILETPEQIIDDTSSAKSVVGVETAAPHKVPVSDPENFKVGQEKEVDGFTSVVSLPDANLKLLPPVSVEESNNINLEIYPLKSDPEPNQNVCLLDNDIASEPIESENNNSCFNSASPEFVAMKMGTPAQAIIRDISGHQVSMLGNISNLHSLAKDATRDKSENFLSSTKIIEGASIAGSSNHMTLSHQLLPSNSYKSSFKNVNLTINSELLMLSPLNLKLQSSVSSGPSTSSSAMYSEQFTESEFSGYAPDVPSNSKSQELKHTCLTRDEILSQNSGPVISSKQSAKSVNANRSVTFASINLGDSNNQSSGPIFNSDKSAGVQSETSSQEDSSSNQERLATASGMKEAMTESITMGKLWITSHGEESGPVSVASSGEGCESFPYERLRTDHSVTAPNAQLSGPIPAVGDSSLLHGGVNSTESSREGSVSRSCERLIAESHRKEKLVQSVSGRTSSVTSIDEESEQSCSYQSKEESSASSEKDCKKGADSNATEAEDDVGKIVDSVLRKLDKACTQQRQRELKKAQSTVEQFVSLFPAKLSHRKKKLLSCARGQPRNLRQRKDPGEQAVVKRRLLPAWCSKTVKKVIVEAMERREMSFLDQEELLFDFADTVKLVMKSKDVEEVKDGVLTVQKQLFDLKIVKTLADFFQFVRNYLPLEFRCRSIPCAGWDDPIYASWVDDSDLYKPLF